MLEGVSKLEFEYWDRMDEDWDSTWEVTSEDFEVSGAVAALTGSNTLSDDVTDEDKTLQLPWRVKVAFELVDEDGNEYPFESQTALYVREPLDFMFAGKSAGTSGRPGGIQRGTTKISPRGSSGGVR